jgi:hypothetical protein
MLFFLEPVQSEPVAHSLKAHVYATRFYIDRVSFGSPLAEFSETMCAWSSAFIEKSFANRLKPSHSHPHRDCSRAPGRFYGPRSIGYAAFAAAGQRLRLAACKHFPDSGFAQK